MENSAICLLCVKPNKIQIDFISKILNYKLFILCDDNNYDINYNSNIEFIKINDNECFENGYKNSNCCIDKNPSAWDKVFYYFIKINPNKYNYVWILEDDVFIPNNDTFFNIDNKYGHADLLCKSNYKYIANKDNIWYSATDKYELPWFLSMVCCCRISNQLFMEIGKYVQDKGELFFIETMINTIANHKNLIINDIEELQNIFAKPIEGYRYRHFHQGKIIWMTKSISNIKKNFIYHPVKNIELQEKLRIKNSF
jgi:hypothetical protein